MGTKSHGKGVQNLPSDFLEGFVGEVEIMFASFLSALMMWMVATGKVAVLRAELRTAQRCTMPEVLEKSSRILRSSWGVICSIILFF